MWMQEDEPIKGYKRIREDIRIYSGGESYFLFTFI